MNLNQRTLYTSIAALVLAAACGDDTLDLGSRYMKSAMVSASSGGGFVVTESDAAEFAGVGIDVPAGALAEDTTITVAPSDDLPSEQGVQWVGPAMDFGPDDLEFSIPATVTLRVDVALGEDDPVVRIVSADGTSEWIEAADIDINADGTWSFLVSHFTTFQPGSTPTTPQSSGCTTDADCGAGERCTPTGICVPSSLAEVTGGSTSVLLDVAALSAAGLDLSGVSDEVIAPGDLGANSVAFPINSRTSRQVSTVQGNAPTTFVYDFVNFAPVSGTIEHNGVLYFDQQFGSGNFSIGFDPARANGTNSGFFVESTTEGFLLIPGIFFDVENPSFVDAQSSSLTIEADLVVAPELAAFLTRPALTGADVGDARISATAQLFTGPPPPVGNIVEVAQAAGNFGTLLQTATDLGLAGILTTPGPFTVFAPTDAAFEALPADLSRVDDAILANIILGHIASGEFDAAALLLAGSVTTLAKVTHEFSLFGIRGASVSTFDVEASNGIIHVLDHVIVPPTIVEAALENDLTELVNAIVSASLATQIAVEPDTLGGDAPVTVFAPTNAAFQAANLQGQDLDAVLATHVVPGQLLASDLTPGRIITTVGGNQLTVGSSGGVVSLTDERGNTFSVLTADIRTLNGAVHVIDGVLLPGQ